MIQTTAEEIHERAERIRSHLPQMDLIPGESVAGGGSTPEQTLPTWLLTMPGDAVANERALRTGDPAVIARIENDRVVLDLRTVFPEDEQELVLRVVSCCPI
jgi:L-seryl-tRNA(Ser) seleniumtransferase